MGKVVGEPYRGKPDVRFDEGTKGRKVRQRGAKVDAGESGVITEGDAIEVS